MSLNLRVSCYLTEKTIPRLQFNKRFSCNKDKLVKHPDHTLITYPNLGHLFYPSSQWLTGSGLIEPYVLADIYSWLEAHSNLSHPQVTATTSAIRVKTS